MAIEVYRAQAMEKARSALGRYRGQIESGIGQAQTVATVGGASYLAARLSAHWGGPDGKNVMGVPLELAIGAACGALAMSGSAGKHTEEVLAVGVGAIAAYTARLGFQAGMGTARPPPTAEVGAAPAYQLPATRAYASLPPAYQDPSYEPPGPQAYEPPRPQAYEASRVQGYEHPQEVAAEDFEEVGADPYADASSVLEQYGRR